VVVGVVGVRGGGGHRRLRRCEGDLFGGFRLREGKDTGGPARAGTG
jgi:hypothetical protein